MRRESQPEAGSEP